MTDVFVFTIMEENMEVKTGTTYKVRLYFCEILSSITRTVSRRLIHLNRLHAIIHSSRKLTIYSFKKELSVNSGGAAIKKTI